MIDDDEEAYSVERLLKMKADHEGRATPIADELQTKRHASLLTRASCR